MKIVFFWTACLLSYATAFPLGKNVWKAPRSTDRRSPCPMLNALANHGYLPRNGLNLSMSDLVVGLKSGVNLAEPATRFVSAKVLSASTTGNPDTFNLDDLNRHGFLEHDGSLSRADTFTGDNHNFNKTIWRQTSSNFTAPTISISTASIARKTRLAVAQAENPQWDLTAEDDWHSMIETALYLAAMSNGTLANGAGATGVKKWVDVLFTQERLPTQYGWTRPAAEISITTVLQLVDFITAV